MYQDWQPRPLSSLGDYIGKAILLICEHGAFKGGLKDITPTEIHIEVGMGEVIAVDRKVLESDLTELYTLS